MPVFPGCHNLDRLYGPALFILAPIHSCGMARLVPPPSHTTARGHTKCATANYIAARYRQVFNSVLSVQSLLGLVPNPIHNLSTFTSSLFLTGRISVCASYTHQRRPAAADHITISHRKQNCNIASSIFTYFLGRCLKSYRCALMQTKRS